MKCERQNNFNERFVEGNNCSEVVIGTSQ